MPKKRLSDWLEGGEAAVILIIAWMALSVLPLRLIVAALRLTVGPVEEVVPGGQVGSTTRKVGLAIERAACRLPMTIRCLHKSLAGALMLHRRGLPATVVLGVRTKDGLKAHAWLLSAGVPVLGWGPTLPFVPLAAFRSKSDKKVR